MSARHEHSREGGSCIFLGDRRAFVRAAALGVLGALAGEVAFPEIARSLGTATATRAGRAELR